MSVFPNVPPRRRASLPFQPLKASSNRPLRNFLCDSLRFTHLLAFIHTLSCTAYSRNFLLSAIITFLFLSKKHDIPTAHTTGKTISVRLSQKQNGKIYKVKVRFQRPGICLNMSCILQRRWRGREGASITLQPKISHIKNNSWSRLPKKFLLM